MKADTELQQAIKEVFDDLRALPREEFERELSKFIPPEDQYFDTVRMLRES